MTERDGERRVRRLERMVNRLRKGRRPGIELEDAPDAAAIRAAARLSGARDPYPRMDPGFRRRLATQMGQPSRVPTPSRRWALAAAAGIVGGAALGVSGDRLLQDRTRPAEGGRAQEGLAPERSDATWVDTGVTVDDLVEGTPRAITAGGLPLFLIRQGRRVRALSSVCTHKPCQLFWDGAGQQIVCPWGRYQTFSLDGTASRDLPPLPLAQVRIQDRRIQVYGVS